MILKHKIPPTLFITDASPPFVHGSVTMMYNLFLGLELNNSALVTQSPIGFSPTKGGGIDNSCSWEISRSEIPGLPKYIIRGSPWGLPRAMMFLQVPIIQREAYQIAKTINPQIVMTCWQFEHFTTAAWLISRKLNLPNID